MSTALVDQIIGRLEFKGDAFRDSEPVKEMLSAKRVADLRKLCRWVRQCNEYEALGIIRVLNAAAKRDEPWLVEVAIECFKDFHYMEIAASYGSDGAGKIAVNAAEGLIRCFVALELGTDGKRPTEDDFQLMIAANYAAHVNIIRSDWRGVRFETKDDYLAAFSVLLPHLQVLKIMSYEFLMLASAAKKTGSYPSIDTFLAAILYLERTHGDGIIARRALIDRRGRDAVVIEAMANTATPALAEGVL